MGRDKRTGEVLYKMTTMQKMLIAGAVTFAALAFNQFVLSGDNRSPGQIADEYALQKSSGERLGCSEAAPGRESEFNRGCVYSVAYAGCYEGITGEDLGAPIEDEFPTERRLQDIYNRAIDECADM